MRRKNVVCRFAGVLLMALLLCAPQHSDTASAGGAADFLIWIDVHQKVLTLYQGRKIVQQWPVATGTADMPTPLGVFRINSRFAGEMSGFGTCFLGLNVPWGQYGIHGTNRPNSIGNNASHGCIRMYVADAEKLYQLVPNWTRVVIEGGPVS